MWYQDGNWSRRVWISSVDSSHTSCSCWAMCLIWGSIESVLRSAMDTPNQHCHYGEGMFSDCFVSLNNSWNNCWIYNVHIVPHMIHLLNHVLIKRNRIYQAECSVFCQATNTALIKWKGMPTTPTCKIPQSKSATNLIYQQQHSQNKTWTVSTTTWIIH